MTDNRHKGPPALTTESGQYIPLGIVLGQDDDGALVAFIEARWREGEFPGPVFGRQGQNHSHEEVANYCRLEILWAAAAPARDYYSGDYDSEAYAHPSLNGRYFVGGDYYTAIWKDLAITEKTLNRLREALNRELRPGEDAREAPAAQAAEEEQVAAQAAELTEAPPNAAQETPKLFIPVAVLKAHFCAIKKKGGPIPSQAASVKEIAALHPGNWVTRGPVRAAHKDAWPELRRGKRSRAGIAPAIAPAIAPESCGSANA